MSLLMACWKKSEFNNTVCSSEITVFYKCVEKAQVQYTFVHCKQEAAHVTPPSMICHEIRPEIFFFPLLTSSQTLLRGDGNGNY